MKRERFLPYLFISPSVLVMAVIVLFPLVYVIQLSFYRSSLLSPPTYVGLRNYLDLFFDDPYYWMVFRNTVLWTAISVAVEFLFSLGVALLLNQDVPGIRIFRGVILLPWVVPPVTAALIWMTFFESGSGLFNHILRQLGFPPQDWLTNPSLVLPSLMAVVVWKYSPVMIVSLLAGLQSIPPELYDAAAVDGADGWKRFRYVTFPLIKPIASTIILLSVIWRAGHFDLVQSLTGGGPANYSELIATYAYDALILRFQAGKSAAIALTGVLAISIFMVAYIRRVGRN